MHVRAHCGELPSCACPRSARRRSIAARRSAAVARPPAKLSANPAATAAALDAAWMAESSALWSTDALAARRRAPTLLSVVGGEPDLNWRSPPWLAWVGVASWASGERRLLACQESAGMAMASCGDSGPSLSSRVLPRTWSTPAGEPRAGSGDAATAGMGDTTELKPCRSAASLRARGSVLPALL